jgi:glycolate oxidase iron-sulfur subunit
MRVADIHELLFEIDAPPAPLTGTPAGRITWQDPCHLGRGLGLTREPREIIAGLPGVEYVEAGMLSCCGGGGAFSLLHYDLALKIGSPRAEALAATGARQVATGCPGCRMQIEDMLARLGSPVKVVHTVELLDDAAVHSKHGEV